MANTAANEFDPQAFLAMVGEGRSVSTFRKNETVFAQGEQADKVFYIRKGRIKVVVLSEQGKEAIVGILESGQFFGESCLNGNPRRISTTTALEDCVITAITKTAMLAALRSEPGFSELFMTYLLTPTAALKPTWSISCSIRARNGWRGFCCCWRTSARKAARGRSRFRSARKPWPR